MISQKTSPLTKALRTSEGVLVWLVNIGLVVGAAIPSDHLSAKTAGILAAANTGLHVASRTLLKVAALQKGLGVGDPTTPAALTSGLGVDAATLAEKLIPQLVSDYEEFDAPPPDDEEPAPAAPEPESAVTPDPPSPVSSASPPQGSLTATPVAE